ncbi:hypothetical protein U27_03797 [Candidatus Vecturithrix granuli]|uniref:Metallo-beta-lactamase domain-containing protein n=1 Tax=Vecturithrix granuli TaxID=1499967 RepID=A0A081BWX8_VECG1|nr:hypothetical protein U27_03797 [Candidatus Vecturithrix granuli]
MREELTITLILLLVFVGIPILVTSISGKENQAMQTERIDNLTLTVLYDNYPSQEGLETAWGFACLIQGAEKTILFDAGGKGAILLANMRKLGFQPDAIELIVLSHEHWDHVGGMQDFLAQQPEVSVYLPHSFSAGFKDEVKHAGANIIEVQEAMQICPQVYSTGDLEGQTREQALILQTGQGMIILTGCAHPGIIKIIKKAKEMLPDEVLLVIGGFHLKDYSRALLTDIIAEFKQSGVKYVGPCHCSGDPARQMFEQAYQNHFIRLGVGKVITLKDLK